MSEEEINQSLGVTEAPAAEPPKDIEPESVESLPSLNTVPEPEKPAEQTEKPFSKTATYVLVALTVIAVALVTIALVLSLR